MAQDGFETFLRAELQALYHRFLAEHRRALPSQNVDASGDSFSIVSQTFGRALPARHPEVPGDSFSIASRTYSDMDNVLGPLGAQPVESSLRLSDLDAAPGGDGGGGGEGPKDGLENQQVHAWQSTITDDPDPEIIVMQPPGTLGEVASTSAGGAALERARRASDLARRASLDSLSSTKSVRFTDGGGDEAAEEDDPGDDAGPKHDHTPLSRKGSFEVPRAVAKTESSDSQGSRKVRQSGRLSVFARGLGPRFEVRDEWKKMMEDEESSEGEEDHRTGKGSGELRGSTTDFEVDSNSSQIRSESSWLAKYMLPPKSPKRIAWDSVGLAFVCYELVWTPLLLLQLEDSSFTLVMEWCSRVFWSIDIPISFLTGFLRRDGMVEMQLDVVARRYLRTWFGFDLLLVNMDWLEVVLSAFAFMQIARISRVSRVVRLLRLLRLVRVAKLSNLMNLFHETVFSERAMVILSIAKGLACLLCFSHVLACIWFWVGENGTSSRRNWVEVYNYAHMARAEIYIASLHWAMTNFIGNINLAAENAVEHCFSVLALLSGFVASAGFVSVITTHMTHLQMIDFEQQHNFSVLCRYLRHQGVSGKLALRVTRNAQFAVEQGRRCIPEGDVYLLQLLSEPVRVDLHFEIYASDLRAHPLFEHYCQTKVSAMKRVCHRGLSVLSLAKGDVLFSAGERPPQPQMLFVRRGRLSYQQDNSPTQEVALHDWLCEAALWTNWRHRGTLVAASECSLVAVDALMFQRISAMSFSHDEDTHPANYATWFVEQLCDFELSELTDTNMDLDTEGWLQRQMPVTSSQSMLSRRFSLGQLGPSTGAIRPPISSTSGMPAGTRGQSTGSVRGSTLSSVLPRGIATSFRFQSRVGAS